MLLAVSAIHVAAILFYLAFRHRNLIGAMISGYRRDDSSSGTLVRAPLWHLIAAIGVALAITYAVSTGLRF